MRVDRLRRVQEFLGSLPEEKFNFSMVANTIIAGRCGSVGCALGWLPNIFPEEDLELAYTGAEAGGYIIYPVRRGQTTQLDVEEFFGISTEDEEYIFERDGYDGDITIDDVIEHITNVIVGD